MVRLELEMISFPRWKAAFSVRLALLAANAAPLAYAGYSYALKGDLYRLELSDNQRQALLAAAQSLAPRNLRAELLHLEKAAQILFLCPRDS